MIKSHFWRRHFKIAGMPLEIMGYRKKTPANKSWTTFTKTTICIV